MLGNDTTRDRASELVAAVARRPEPAAPALDFDRPWPWTVGAIVLHVIEELFQHAGHVDITTDLVLSDRAGS